MIIVQRKKLSIQISRILVLAFPTGSKFITNEKLNKHLVQNANNFSVKVEGFEIN